jgi:hypothetical protein
VQPVHNQNVDPKEFALFQAAKLARTALFWIIARRVVAISYRRFGITYRSNFLRSKILDS